MNDAPATPRSMVHPLAVYAAITLLLVLALGVVLAITFRTDARNRGLAEGRSEATIIAQTAVEPELDPQPLSAGLTSGERAAMELLVGRAVEQGHILRLRLRDLTGRVVFSDDGSGIGSPPDDEAVDAAHGKVVSHLTHLNSDDNDDDDSDAGVSSVEVYLPLTAGTPARRIGVLEIYLPYSPIAADVDAGLRGLYTDLGFGLAALYLLLFAITLSATRGLRREVATSTFLATHDALTSLPNRTLFLDRARDAIKRAAASGQPAAIAIIDLDHFKDINDTLGHQSGDQLLTQLADRVRANMRPGDVVARLGGDEFGLALCDVADPGHALLRLREVVSGDVEVRGLALSLEPSIGFVIASATDVDVDTLMQQAEVAMYAAKAQHAGVMSYRPELDHYDAANLALVSELRQAIAGDQLVLHYQPQADPRTGRIKAVEALVRWQHPIHGLLPPGRFLALAEQTELIDKLTDWVLATALREVRHLSELGSDIAVAVNVSARSIVRDDFTPRVLQALADSGVPAHRLIVEVTETALLTDPVRAATALRGLADAGVVVSLDDFGHGQTSLRYLSTLPIQELKIDRSFVTDMSENDAHAAIVRSIIDLGHNLSFRVVAEGIETAHVLAMLAESDCDLAQGYYLARPMAADRLVEWLAGAGHAVTAESSALLAG